MNKQIIKNLVELEIFNSNSLTEKEYAEASSAKSDGNFIYLTNEIELANGEARKFYKQIDTKGLTEEEIKLLLEIDRTKNIRSIKKMAIFFVVLTLISVVIAIWSGASIASML